jgi:adenylate kinase family enzyme
MTCSSTYYEPVFFFFLSLQLDEMLDKQGAKIDKVLNFAIDDAILEERITGRWIHPSSGRTYHTKFSPPKVPGVDDVRLHLYLSPAKC